MKNLVFLLFGPYSKPANGFVSSNGISAIFRGDEWSMTMYIYINVPWTMVFVKMLNILS